jgi:MFS family permease
MQAVAADDAAAWGAPEELRWLHDLSTAPPSWPAHLGRFRRLYLRNKSGSWHVLAERRFRAYFIGCTISNLGTWLQNTAQLLLAYRLTHNAFDIAQIVSAQFVGFLTVGPWAGGLAARMGTRRLLICTQLASAAIAGVLACLKLTDHLTVPALACGALLTGLATTFALPVQTTLLSALVRPDESKAALAMNSASYNFGRTAAPALCLAIMATIGAAWDFAFNGLSFLVFAAVVAACCPARTTVRQHVVRPRGVASIALRRPRILLLLAMVAAVTFGDDPIFVLGPSVAHHMGVPGFWPAYFLTGLGVGTIFGALVPKRGFASTPIVVRGERQSAEPAHTRRAALPLVVLAVAVMIFVVAPGPWVCAAAAAAAGIAGLVTGSTAQALLLQLATPAYALQVMALWGVAWAGTKPIASLIDGAVASQFGITAAAVVLVIPAFTIGMAEICLTKAQKDCLKARMSQWNGTVARPAAEAAVRDAGI